MIRHVSFDFDGTLASGSNEAYLDYYLRALQKVGVQLDPQIARERIFARWGQAVEDEFALLLKEYPDKVDEAVTYFNAAKRSLAFREQVSLYPGASNVIRTLSQNYKLSIVSGAIPELITSVLGDDLVTFFTSILTGTDRTAVEQKPAPVMLYEAMRAASVSPEETIYIGDAPNDLRMAQAAGTASIAILTGHLTHLQAKELGARAIIENIIELPDAIGSL